MPNLSKVEAVAEIKGRFQDSSSVLLADYRGLSVKEMQVLRKKMGEAGGAMSVYKNSLTQIALRELEMPEIDDMLAGPTAFTFASGDPVAPAKVLADFMKEHPALELKGGIIDGVIVDAAGIKALASLPSRDELLAKLMGTLMNPVRGFMTVANGPASALVRTMKAVADQMAAA